MKDYTISLGNGSTFRSYNIEALTAKEAITEAKEKVLKEEGKSLVVISVWQD